ncbi:ribonuclease III [Imleria badia]|nr:ribonuclease III [Imleria badia]
MSGADIQTMERLLLAETAYSTPQRLRPSQVVIQYEPTHTRSQNRLTQEIHQLDPSGGMYESLFRDAHCALQELGSCASDLVWRRSPKEIAWIPERHNGDPAVKGPSKIRNLIENWEFSMPNANPSSRGFNVTPKFSRLIQVLRAYEPCGDDFRGIIFVRQCCVATIMVDMLRVMTNGLEFLRPFAVTGNLPVIDAHYQADMRRDFEAGKYNLLIVTKALEDLDIPPALLVIRYDTFESQLSFSYACAYACLPSSRVVHMVENGSDESRQVLTRFLEGAFSEWWIPVIIHSGGVPIPPSPLVENWLSSQFGDEATDSWPCIEDPVTGRRLYEHDALEALYRFVAVTQKADFSGAPLLITREVSVPQNQQAWICTATLPVGLPVDHVTGPCRLTPTHARRSTAYEVCVQLYEHGAFHNNLFPVAQHHLKPDTSGSAALAADKVSGNRCYPRKRSLFWSNSIRLHKHRLFPFVVYVDRRGVDYTPIMLLTRQPLPHIPSFRLFFPGTSEAVGNLRAPPLELDERRMEALYLFTLRICRAIYNKPLVCPLEKMAYMLAPLKLPEQVDAQSLDPVHLTDYISWDTIELAGNTWMVKFDLEELHRSSEGVHDLIVQDRLVEFTRRYYVARLRRDLTPLSKPEDSPREAGYANLVEYCKARRKGFEGLSDYSQPLIEVSGVIVAGNHLNPTTRVAATEPVKAAVKYLIPELSAKFTIPASTFRTALLLPSITKRIEDFLIVHELNANLFGYSIHENLLLSAISAPSAGCEVDYERLEFFGDSFLKYLASVYVFVTNPAQQEGALHAARQRIINNKVLMQNADRIGLPQYVQSKPFSHKLWYPPNFTVDPPSMSSIADPAGSGDEIDVTANVLQGKQDSVSQDGDKNASNVFQKKVKLRDENVTQWLGDKTIADVTEAIIGAAYMSGGQDNALQAAKALQVPIPLIHQWQDFRRVSLAVPPVSSRPLRQGTTEAVEAIIGHRFRLPHLLAQALTHASVDGYDTTCYERLEFLGDAILDFLTVQYIFRREDHLSPGAMTMLRGAMVSNAALAALCVSCGLHKHLHFDSYALASTFEAYVQQVEAKRLEAEETAEGSLPRQHWLQVEPPKALSDIVESIIGALYVSDGFRLDGAEKFFKKVLKPFYDRHITLKTLSHHPTKILFELLQSHGCQQFELVKERNDLTQETRCDCIIHQTTLASAMGATAQAAGRAASVLALDALQCNPEILSRTCDCRENRRSNKGAQARIKRMLVEIEDGGNVV